MALTSTTSTTTPTKPAPLTAEERRFLEQSEKARTLRVAMDDAKQQIEEQAAGTLRGLIAEDKRRQIESAQRQIMELAGYRINDYESRLGAPIYKTGVQFYRNGTAMVGGHLFTISDAIRMILNFLGGTVKPDEEQALRLSRKLNALTAEERAAFLKLL